MGPVAVARSGWACLAVVCGACSLVVDFPDKAPRVDGGADGSIVMMDAAPDGARDARGDAEPDAPDALPVQACTTNASCDSNELCCGAGAAMECVETSAARCTACTGGGCESPTAPHCGDRACECVAGTNKPCDDGQICDSSSGSARCVECSGDGDCAMKAAMPYCENSKCVQCKRGALLDSAADDVGCTGKTPICGSDNACIGCDDALPATACTPPSVCTPGIGCYGCKVDAAIGANGCTESEPICKVADGAAACAGCTLNSECMFSGGLGYCAAGRCSNKCDGDSPPGANGCANPALPFCKPASVAGGFDCAACAAADCTSGTFCATEGPLAGTCVGCRTSVDCPQNGLAPVCDAATFACRARTLADCAATPATPYLSAAGTCVECTESTQCAGNVKGAVCNPTTNVCVGCITASDCKAEAPSCNAAGACVAQCAGDNFCRAAHPATPFCNDAMTTCVECKASANCTASLTKPICDGATGACVACTTNGECQGKIAGTRCVTASTYAGACSDCTSCAGMQTCGPNLLCQ